MLKDLKIFKIFILLCWIFLSVIYDTFTVSPQRVVFLDVGQGDTILIQKDNFEILVDGGGDESVIYKMGEYMKWDDRLVDVVVITHMHTDHYRGIKYLMERYEIGIFLISPNCKELCTEFREYNHKELTQGMSFEYSGIEIDILWPRVGYVDKNINNDSIILLVKYLDKRILLMGDAEKEVEEELLKSYGVYITNIDILKAGHHCSKTASTFNFLKTSNPKLSICSCGEENKFGHPHKEALDRFEKLKIGYYITWEEGDYVVE